MRQKTAFLFFEVRNFFYTFILSSLTVKCFAIPYLHIKPEFTVPFSPGRRRCSRTIVPLILTGFAVSVVRCQCVCQGFSLRVTGVGTAAGTAGTERPEATSKYCNLRNKFTLEIMRRGMILDNGTIWLYIPIIHQD